MQVVPPGGQKGNQSKLHYNLEPMLVAPPGGQILNNMYNWPNLDPIQVAIFLAGEITQVKESIPWVHCASGNVFIQTCWEPMSDTGVGSAQAFFREV